MTTGNSDNIFEAIIRIEKLEKWLKTYQYEILQLSGAQDEWKRSEEVSKTISSVLRSLQDLGGYLTIAGQDLSELHTSKELLYQTLLA